MVTVTQCQPYIPLPLMQKVTKNEENDILFGNAIAPLVDIDEEDVYQCPINVSEDDEETDNELEYSLENSFNDRNGDDDYKSRTSMHLIWRTGVWATTVWKTGV
jgi:hypothetical protein